MRTIKETAWLILDGDGLTHQYLEDSQTTHILEIEIDVPNERDKVLLAAVENIALKSSPFGVCWFCQQMSPHLGIPPSHTTDCAIAKATALLKPRPPRATIREVEK